MDISKMNKEAVIKFLADSRAELTELATRGTDLVGEDAERFDTLEAQHKEAREHLAKIEARMDALKQFGANSDYTDDPKPQNRDDKSTNTLRGKLTLSKGESLRQWEAQNGHIEGRGTGLSLDKLLRGMASGRWEGSEAERALVTTNSTAIVPTPLGSEVIDLARAKAVVLKAGATVVPMTSKTLRVPRLTGEGSPAFYAEGAQRVAQDLTFDSVTLDAKTFDRLILISKELLEDSNPDIGDVISNAFAAQYALGIDKFALFGDGVAPNPLGIVNVPAVPKVSHGANGTAVTNYDWLIQAYGNVLSENFLPTAQIGSPRTATSLALLKNSQGDYLTPPANLPSGLVSSVVPNNVLQGTSTDTSYLITGDFTQLYIGLRSEFTIKVLEERYADTGQVAFLASSRWDVAVAQPKAFQVDLGLRA
ncbi:phage major capsid protein [Rhodococcus sp. 05-2255-3B1]|uniref:phage major capsid protein n=1 Tax=unclassified Rhodococcus (in: high G+C Gram-positive bacteria) TaxID=192944 RepID=UPI000B9B353F|nr:MULTISPECIES: phage major capsid protein [unclassified Rhodococcus (in: high G+C Gram-positive bacteria)]OZE03171.1 phage major capsid protein [Rhodococcus sp. 05-2255-3C]OZE09560.1 phage major capsid protein [Rhodococcus sp. 05-2255-3B1]OZE14826.1 phage major capsid protein [Rhodococcus sp. 05-2255-2A2]